MLTVAVCLLFVRQNSKAGTAVFQVTAADPDDPNTPNGKLLYSFLDNTANNGLFLIGRIYVYGNLYLYIHFIYRIKYVVCCKRIFSL